MCSFNVIFLTYSNRNRLQASLRNDWDEKLSMSRCQTRPSLYLWAQQQSFPFLCCTLCNWSQRLRDAKTSRDSHKEVCSRPNHKHYLPENGRRHRGKSNKSNETSAARLEQLTKGGGLIPCSHSGGTQGPLEADKKAAGVMCVTTLFSHECVTLICVPPLLFSSHHLVKADKRRHGSNMLLMANAASQQLQCGVVLAQTSLGFILRACSPQFGVIFKFLSCM